MISSSSHFGSCLVGAMLVFFSQTLFQLPTVSGNDHIVNIVKTFTENVENLKEQNARGIVQVTEGTDAETVLKIFTFNANKLRQIVLAYKELLTKSLAYIHYRLRRTELVECDTYLNKAFPTNVDEFLNYKILSEAITNFGNITNIIKRSVATAENEQKPWTREIESLCRRIDAVLKPILEQLKLVNDWRNRDMKEFLNMVRKFIENLEEKPQSHGIVAQVNEEANEADAGAVVLNAFLANSNKLRHIGQAYKNLLSEASKYYDTTKHMQKCEKYNKYLEHFPKNIEEVFKFDKLLKIIDFYRYIANDIDTFSTVGDNKNPLRDELKNLRTNIDKIIEPIVEQSNFLEIWRKCSNFVKSYEETSTKIQAKVHRFETVVNGIIEKATMSLASFISQEFLKRQSGLENLKSETCKLREELKRQSVEMPKEMAQIEAYFAFEQKVSTSQIDTMLYEYYKFAKLMDKHYPGETYSVEEHQMMHLKMRMYYRIFEFLEATEEANVAFMKSLESEFFHHSVGNIEVEGIMRSYTSFYDYMYLMNAIKFAKKRLEQHFALLIRDPKIPTENEVDAETVNLWALGEIVEDKYKKLKNQRHTEENNPNSIFTSYEKFLEDAESVVEQFDSIRTNKYHLQSRDDAKAKFEHQIETNVLLMKRPEYYAELLFNEWAKKNGLKGNSVDDEIEHESMANAVAEQLALSPKRKAMETENEEVEAAASSSTGKGLKEKKSF